MVKTRHALRARLALEELETRQVLSAVQPTPMEQLFLEELNDARANPAAYGASIGLDLSGVAPSQPLAFDPRMVDAALGHSIDMNVRNYFAHNSPPPNPTDPGARLTASGFPWSGWGESIAAGNIYPLPADALKALIIDAGIPDLGHRRHLLAIDPSFQGMNQVGIGIVQGGTGLYQNYYTIDTASSFNTRQFITGVVFNDLSGNNKYDLNEGLAGVTITVTTPSGAFVASASDFVSGGYSIQVGPGVYNVTASGPTLPSPVTRVAAVGATNFRLNFSPSYDGYVTKLFNAVLGRAPSNADLNSWSRAIQYGGMALAASVLEHTAEARTRLVKGWYQTYLGRSAVNGEEQTWVQMLVAGATEEHVLPWVLASQEYFIRAGTLQAATASSTTYLKTLYSQLLGRAASASDINYWLGALPVLGRAGVASLFLSSSEFRARLVRSYYTNLLHRPTAPSAAEVSFWVNSGYDLTTMRALFESSAEFAVNG